MKEVERLSNKVLTLRLFEDDANVFWKKNISDIENGQILCGM